MSKRWTIEDVQRLKDGQLPEEKKPSKYSNEKTVIDGITFDSKKEAARYGILKLLLRSGLIKNLRLQVPFRLQINEVLICTYKCDFAYYENDKLIVEDVKSSITKSLPVYRLKKKLMLALKGIEIREV